MLNFESIEDLVSYMFELIDGEEPVSAVANKELSTSILKELLEYNNVILKYANVDGWKYDKEYIVTLHKDLDTEFWDIAIEPIYSYENEKYLGIDGYVLFHEDVNSKVMINMQNNENIELSGHDWFIINENTDESDDSVMDSGIKHDSGYRVTVKVDLDTDEAEEMIRDMRKNFSQEVSDMFDMLYRPYLYEYHPRIRFFW